MKDLTRPHYSAVRIILGEYLRTPIPNTFVVEELISMHDNNGRIIQAEWAPRSYATYITRKEAELQRDALIMDRKNDSRYSC